MEAQTGDRKRARDDRKSERGENLRRRQSASRTRLHGTRFQRSHRPPRSQSSPSLLDFAPDLLSKFGSSPSSYNTENQDPVRDEEESPFRSPLHKSRRGLQNTTPLRSRRGPHNVGSHGSGQRATRMRRTAATTPSQDDSEHGQGNDRRVRKCLWADEEDEAFCDDDLPEEPVVARDPPKTPTKDQLTRRQKDIDYGKATSGYKNYLERVPKEQRGNLCPQTPDKYEKVSRRAWDANIRFWRRSLHQWDAPAKQTPSTTPLSSPNKIQTRPAGTTTSRSRRGKGMSPTSSVASSPSDRGYVTTPDSRGDHSLLDLGEEEDERFLLGGMDFPPLPSSGQKRKQWWEIVEEEEKRAEEMEEGNQLDQCVRNLSIGNNNVWSRQHRDEREMGAEGGAAEGGETQEGDQAQD